MEFIQRCLSIANDGSNLGINLQIQAALIHPLVDGFPETFDDGSQGVVFLEQIFDAFGGFFECGECIVESDCDSAGGAHWRLSASSSGGLKVGDIRSVTTDAASDTDSMADGGGQLDRGQW